MVSNELAAKVRAITETVEKLEVKLQTIEDIEQIKKLQIKILWDLQQVMDHHFL